MSGFKVFKDRITSLVWGQYCKLQIGTFCNLAQQELQCLQAYYNSKHMKTVGQDMEVGDSNIEDCDPL